MTSKRRRTAKQTAAASQLPTKESIERARAHIIEPVLTALKASSDVTQEALDQALLLAMFINSPAGVVSEADGNAALEYGRRALLDLHAVTFILAGIAEFKVVDGQPSFRLVADGDKVWNGLSRVAEVVTTNPEAPAT